MNITKKNLNIPITRFEKKFETDEKLWLSKNRTKRYIKKMRLIKKFYNNTNITPTSDFYNWINNDWLKNFQVAKNDEYIVQFDDFRLVQDKVYRELLEIVNDYLKTSKHSTFGKCLNNFYQSSVTFSTIEHIRENAIEVLSKIDDLMKDKNNLWKLLGYLNRVGGELNSPGLPFIYGMLPDEKEPSTFRTTINGPNFILVDINVYFEDGDNSEYKKNYKRHYFKYIRDLFKEVFGKDYHVNPEEIFDLQVKMLESYGKTTEKEGEHNYNKVTRKDAIEKYNMNWDDFSLSLGFKKPPEWFITTSLNYLKYTTTFLLKEWNTPAFRTYFIYNYIRQTSLFCKKTREIIFQFRGKFERGEISNYVDTGIHSIYELGLAFNTFLSNQYIKKYKNEQNIEYLKVLTQELKEVFIRIIHSNTWLSPKTKKYAILKLNKMKLIIGSHPVLRRDPILSYGNNFLKNMLMIFEWRYKQTLLLEGMETRNIDIPTMDWNQYPPKFTGTQPYVVNASYTPSINSIYIPLGYIQKPFIDVTMSIEDILAHVGFTLAHEMSHSLDDWGSKYDHYGKLNNWWTKEDDKIFKRKQHDVLIQYKEFARRDGIKYDVELGLGEDMSDISGLALCVEYLANLHTYKKYNLPIQLLSYKLFFMHYAEQMRQHIFKKALKANLKTNPHPLDKYRTNIPLSRLTIFREIYNVTKKDKMWWHNTDTIW